MHAHRPRHALLKQHLEMMCLFAEKISCVSASDVCMREAGREREREEGRERESEKKVGSGRVREEGG